MKWSDTQIWQEIERRQDAVSKITQTYLQDLLPNIETVLKSGGSSPQDFTLHDDCHSFRVAQRMTEIVGEDLLTKLSSYELALLLLSAYLHDIGMTPKENKVNRHYKYLLTAEEDVLSNSEVEEFCKWLDDEESGVIPPITTDPITGTDIEFARKLITYYCRSQHNVWSGEWIEENITNGDLGDYKGFRHDLTKLCKSHHYGRKELEQSDFNPRLVDQEGNVVQLRYLACVLRIADILEFDPERTPDVILQHRDVVEESVTFWHKDHEIAFAKENNRLVMSARPTNAIIHKAIEDTCDQIDDELQLCRMLADSTHFEICPGLQGNLPHNWMLVSAVYRDLTPRDNSYEYINGAFRPNTQKILEMLSGIELYGNPLTSVRELLQNAFDAVREQIAYERLNKPCPSDRNLAETLGKLHRVELRLEKRGEEFWLICTDTGVGMNKRIICNHLLVSGQPRRHDILDLERKCHKSGFNLGRTGKFGIGVLSYFMIADRLIIKTRRSLEPKDGDSNGWVFESRGVGTFGELRRDNALDKGSKVELRLRKVIVDEGAKEWYQKLREYLVSILRFIPCEFHFNSALPECKNIEMKPGWTKNINEIKHKVERGCVSLEDEKKDEKLLPKRIKEILIARNDRKEEIKSKVLQRLKWISETGDLPGDIGRYLLFIIYFELADGNSLLFLDDDKKKGIIKIKNLLVADSYIPEFNEEVSWKGILPRTRHDFDCFSFFSHTSRFPSIFYGIDFHDEEACVPQINRNGIQLKPKGKEALKWIHKKGDELIREFLKDNSDSQYFLLNKTFFGEPALNKDYYWLGNKEKYSSERILQKIQFPALNSVPWEVIYDIPRELQFRGKRVTVLSPALINNRSREALGLSLDWTCPDKIVLAYKSYRQCLTPLWEKLPENAERNIGTNLRVCSFPPKWKNLSGVIFENSKYNAIILNKASLLCKYIGINDWNWAQELCKDTDPLSISDVLLNNRGRAIAWILHCVKSNQKNIWDGLIERSPDFLKNIWKTVFLLSGCSPLSPSIVLWKEHFASGSKCILLSPNCWKVLDCKDGSEEILKYLPDPGSKWKLIEIKEETEKQKNKYRSTIVKKRKAKKKTVKKKSAVKKAKKAKKAD